MSYECALHSLLALATMNIRPKYLLRYKKHPVKQATCHHTLETTGASQH